MTDIVQRLKEAGEEWYECCDNIHLLLFEAADHIVALTPNANEAAVAGDGL